MFSIQFSSEGILISYSVWSVKCAVTACKAYCFLASSLFCLFSKPQQNILHAKKREKNNVLQICSDYGAYKGINGFPVDPHVLTVGWKWGAMVYVHYFLNKAA